jgi:hypothetical protein
MGKSWGSRDSLGAVLNGLERHFQAAPGAPRRRGNCPHLSRFPGIQRRGGDSNPRRTERPLPVFETATVEAWPGPICRDFVIPVMTVGKSVGKSRPLDRRSPRRTSDASRAPGATMVRKGSSVRVRQRAPTDLQGKRTSLRGSIRGLAHRRRNSRPRSVHFATPRVPVGEANQPAVWSTPWVPPAGDSFSASARSAPSFVPPPGGPAETWGPPPVALLAAGRDRSLDVAAARRGRRAEVRPRGPP